MARTKQTARKTTAGKAPAGRLPSAGKKKLTAAKTKKLEELIIEEKEDEKELSVTEEVVSEAEAEEEEAVEVDAAATKRGRSKAKSKGKAKKTSPKKSPKKTPTKSLSPKVSPSKAKSKSKAKAKAKGKVAKAEKEEEEEFDTSRPCEETDRKVEGFYSLAVLKHLAQIREITGYSKMGREQLCQELQASAPAIKVPSKAPSKATSKATSKAVSPKKSPKKTSTKKTSTKKSSEKKTKIPKHETIIDALEKKPAEYSILLGLIKANPKILKLLEGKGPNTLFAPNNDAFAAKKLNITAKMTKTITALDGVPIADILAYHVLNGRTFTVEELAAHPGKSMTLQGTYLPFRNQNGTVVLGSILHEAIPTRQKGEKRTKNGVIIFIDNVLFPSAEKEASPAKKVSPAKSKKVSPTKKPSPKAKTATKKSAVQNTIVDVLKKHGFKRLEMALDAADLTKELRGKGPFTFFAPIDKAWNEMDNGTTEALFANPALLKKLLQFHIVEGKLPLAAIQAKGVHPTTLEGEQLKLRKIEGTVSVGAKRDGVEVVSTHDLAASNGLVHAITGIIVPPSLAEEIAALPGFTAPTPKTKGIKTLYDLINELPALSTFATVVDAAGYAEKLQGKGPYTVYAPSYKAWDKLEGGILYDLLKPAHQQELKNVLKAHILKGEQAPTIAGAAYEASNGVLYIVDEVLLGKSAMKKVSPAKSKKVSPAKSKKVSPAKTKKTSPSKKVSPAKSKKVSPAKSKKVSPAKSKKVSPAKKTAKGKEKVKSPAEIKEKSSETAVNAKLNAFLGTVLAD